MKVDYMVLQVSKIIKLCEISTLLFTAPCCIIKLLQSLSDSKFIISH